MKVSVLMIDGSFRENTYGAEYFTNQNFPEDEFEVIWVEYYERAKEELYLNDQLKVITLNYPRESMYHSSLCFNKGITEAKGDILIIPDADVIVEPDFIQKVWNIHQEYEKLVVYGYRYNEMAEDRLNSLDINELKQKCLITNPTNYGGCLTVRRKWMLEINGYDQHQTFESGFHSNGFDIFTRFRNYGLAIQWEHSLKLYHPMHAFTAEKAPEYANQRKLIQWRSKMLDYRPLNGIDPDLDTENQFPDHLITGKEKNKEKEEKKKTRNKFFKKLKRRVFK